MKKRFSMVAYTGSVIYLNYWGRTIFDLDGISHHALLPCLRQHDDLKSVGVIEEVKRGPAGLMAKGYFVETADGQECAALLKQGYPMQASIRVTPEKIEELEKGKKAVVNGLAVEGRLTIVRHASLAEISMVSLGADNRTSVQQIAANLGAGPGSWETDPELRAAFGDNREAFLAYQKGVQAGRVNITTPRVIKATPK
jgi:hypothetical protein